MNPSYGIVLWIVIGGLAGWIASKIMGTDARQGIVANVLIGIGGALLGGYVAREFLGHHTTHGYLGSFIVALLGSCVVIFAWKLISGRRS